MPRRKPQVYWCKHQSTELVEKDLEKMTELRRCVECEHLLLYKYTKIMIREWMPDTPFPPDGR